jgi:hypothetical protein
VVDEDDEDAPSKKVKQSKSKKDEETSTRSSGRYVIKLNDITTVFLKRNYAE